MKHLSFVKRLSLRKKTSKKGAQGEINRDAVDGRKRREEAIGMESCATPPPTEGPTDLFLSHDWGVNQINHNRVKLINRRLQELGYTTWFDEEHMHGQVRKCMCDGIDNTSLVLVFLTENYMSKINGDNPSDNCLLECNYLFNKKKKFLCVVMDDHMTNMNNWKGELRMMFASNLFVCMSGSFQDEAYFSGKMEELQRQLRWFGVRPTNGKKNTEISRITRPLSDPPRSNCFVCGQTINPICLEEHQMICLESIKAGMEANLKSIQNQDQVKDQSAQSPSSQYTQSKSPHETSAKRKVHRRTKSASFIGRIKKKNMTSNPEPQHYDDSFSNSAADKITGKRSSRRRSVSTQDISCLTTNSSTPNRDPHETANLEKACSREDKVYGPFGAKEFDLADGGRLISTPISRKVSISTPDVRSFTPRVAKDLAKQQMPQQSSKDFTPRCMGKARIKRSSDQEQNNVNNFCDEGQSFDPSTSPRRPPMTKSLSDQDDSAVNSSIDFKNLMSDVDNAHARRSLSDKEQYMVYLNDLMSDTHKKIQHFGSSLDNLVPGVSRYEGKKSRAEKDGFVVTSLDNLGSIARNHQRGRSTSNKERYKVSSLNDLLSDSPNDRGRRSTSDKDRLHMSSLDNLLSDVSIIQGRKPGIDKRCSWLVQEPPTATRSLQDLHVHSSGSPQRRSSKKTSLGPYNSITVDVTRDMNTTENRGTRVSSKNISLSITLKF